jgi:HEAT repeat protein
MRLSSGSTATTICCLFLAGLISGCPEEPPPEPGGLQAAPAEKPAPGPEPAASEPGAPADPLAGLEPMPEMDLPEPVAAMELDCAEPPRPVAIWRRLCLFADKAEYEQHPEAARKLLAMGGEKVVPQLRRALRSDKPLVVEWAAKVCKDLGPKAAAAVPELAAMQRRDGLEWHRPQQMALEALGAIGPAAEPALPIILEVSRRGFNAYGIVSGQGSIAEALAGPGKPYREVVAALLELAAADDVVGRRAALKGLGRLQPEAEGLAAALEPRLSDEDEQVRLYAAATLYKLGDHQDAALLERIAAGLEAEDAKTRQRAAWAVAQVGPAAEPLVDRLLAGVEKEDDTIARLAMLRSLGAVGRPAGKVLPVLRRAAAKPGDIPSRAAIAALTDMGPAAKPALGLLRKLARKHKGSAKGLEAARAARAIRGE